MKAFSILSVVLSHTHIIPPIRTTAYLLCLPAFFFLAGIFTNTQLSPKIFFLKKTTRLLIPYIIWGLLSWIPWVLKVVLTGGDSEVFVSWWLPLCGILCGKAEWLIHNTPLWFLCCIISLEWLYYTICQYFQSWLRWITILCIGIFGCLIAHLGYNFIWEISVAMIMLPVYAVGAENSILQKKNINTIKPLYLVILFIISAIGVWIGYKYNWRVRLSRSIISNPILFYLTTISAIGLWFALSVCVEKLCKHLKLLHYIGQNTLLIMCAHIPVFGMIKGIAMLCHVSLDFFETTAGCLCLWAGAFIILLPVAYFINKYCPWMVGKKHSNP